MKNHSQGEKSFIAAYTNNIGVIGNLEYVIDH